MRIEAVDFFYLAMPEVTDEADGSQDALLVRVAAGGHIGWGECEAAPLPSIAAFVCPKSHGVCRPVGDSVLGKPLRDPSDIAAHVGGGRLQFDGPAAGRAHLVGRRDGAVGSARQGARRAGVEDARLRAEPSEDALRFGAVRRHAGGNAGAGARHPGEGFPRREVRLGPDRARHAPRRTPSISPPRAKGLGADAHPAGRYRADLHRRRRARGRSGCRRWSRRARPGSRSRSPRARLRPMGRWRSAAGKREARRRRRRAQCRHGEAPDRLWRRRLHPDRLRPHRRHRPVQSRLPTMRSRKA